MVKFVFYTELKSEPGKESESRGLPEQGELR
jgi:hypothetical protein